MPAVQHLGRTDPPSQSGRRVDQRIRRMVSGLATAGAPIGRPDRGPCDTSGRRRSRERTVESVVPIMQRGERNQPVTVTQLLASGAPAATSATELCDRYPNRRTTCCASTGEVATRRPGCRAGPAARATRPRCRAKCGRERGRALRGESAGRRWAAITVKNNLHIVVDTIGRLRQVGNVDHELDRCGVHI